jgi:hypothetical protein
LDEARERALNAAPTNDEATMMTRSDAGRRAAPGGRERARWTRSRASAFAVLVAAGLMLAPAAASAAEADAPSGPHRVDPKDRVSPYARVAREHQEQKPMRPARGRPVKVSNGRSTHAAGHARR